MKTIEHTEQPPNRRPWRLFKKPSKRLFWAWIAYQAIKGTTTASLIWAPLIYMWFHHH